MFLSAFLGEKKELISSICDLGNPEQWGRVGSEGGRGEKREDGPESKFFGSSFPPHPPKKREKREVENETNWATMVSPVLSKLTEK